MLDDWSDIAPSIDPTQPNLRRADPMHKLDFWRGRDSRGRYIFQLDGAGSTATIPAWPAPAGIDVLPMDFGTEGYSLRLTLTDADDRELFRALCITLLDATASLERNSVQALSIVVDLLARWQDMLARRKNSLLSSQQVRGLFGELLFLRDELLPRLEPLAAIHSWRGPYGDEQDFLLGGTIFEVKTTLATSDRRLNISSEDQLDTSSGPIILAHQNISVAQAENPEARSLNGLVADIREIAAKNMAASDLFELGLLEIGYDARPDYDAPHWLLTDRVCYDVSEGFPRITRQMLLPGVEEVHYRLRTEACKSFVIDINARLEELLSGRE